MADSKLLAQLKTFLTEKSDEVLNLEIKAKELIHDKGDEASYRDAMTAKAELLANLYDDAEKLINKLSRSSKNNEIIEQIKSFSRSASNSLEIGSVFFMSALLYPHDHKDGEDNDLQAFIKRI